MTWARHRSDTGKRWHQVRPAFNGSVPTLCKGRWPIQDEEAGEVERSDTPPFEDRCSACEDVALEGPSLRRQLPAWDLSDADGDG